MSLIFWFSFMKVFIGLVSSWFIGLILFLHEEEKFLYSLYIRLLSYLQKALLYFVNYQLQLSFYLKIERHTKYF